VRSTELVAGLALACLSSACAGEVDDAPAAHSSAPDDSDLAAVQAWLAAGEYLDWERHDPEPAAGMVGGARVYLSPELAASLRSGAGEHPPGSAAVREIVDAEDPDTQIGWAFSHKLEAGEAGAEEQAWFFYEVFDLDAGATPLTAERGAPGCVGCHGEGVDFVRSQL
jgi:hypothetical protein